ncbi:MAG: hypothetical protein ABL860_06295 [Candidatus Nitrotoga sp.]
MEDKSVLPQALFQVKEFAECTDKKLSTSLIPAFPEREGIIPPLHFGQDYVAGTEREA